MNEIDVAAIEDALEAIQVAKTNGGKFLTQTAFEKLERVRWRLESELAAYLNVDPDVRQAKAARAEAMKK